MTQSPETLASIGSSLLKMRSELAELKVHKITPGQRIGIFIDGPNLYATAKILGFDIDYLRLRMEFQSRGALLRAFYYTTIMEDQEYSSIRPLIDWLDYNATPPSLSRPEFIAFRPPQGERQHEGRVSVTAMELRAYRPDGPVLRRR